MDQKHSQTHKSPATRPSRWPAAKLIATARARTTQLANDNVARTQRMLAKLLAEAGWNEADFLEAFVQDVVAKGSPAPSRRPR